MSSADIRDILDRRAVPYCMHTQSVEIDITACLDPASERGNLLLDFLLATVHFRQTASKELLAKVLEYLQRDDCSEKKEENTTYLSGDHDIIVVQKPCQ